MSTIPPNNTSGLYGINGTNIPVDDNVYANNISATGNVTVDGYIISQGSITTDSNFVGDLIGNVAANTVSATGNITTDAYFIGDGSQLTNLPGSNYGNANVEAYLPTYTGELNPSTVSASGNITADYYFGDGSQLTGLPATYSNANVVTLMANFGSNTVSTTGNITGGYILGNGSQLTGLPATYGNANVANYLPTYSGNLNPNTISAAGNITGLNLKTSGLTGNITGANYVSASYFVGDGSLLTNLPTSNVTLSGNLAGNLQGNGYGANAFAFVSATGNVTGGNINTAGGVYVTGVVSAAGNVRGGNINTAGIVSASGNVIAGTGAYLIGDGSLITNLPGGSYGNANVANFLPTYSGILTAGSVSATGNITGNYIFGNGSQLTGLPATYGNANVAAYLPTYTGNIGNTTSELNLVGANVILNSSVGPAVTVYSAGPDSYLNASGLAAAYLPGANFNGATNTIELTKDTTISGRGLDITGNLFGTSNSITTAGNISTAGILTNGYYYANGTPVTFGGGSTYGNSNVNALLSAWGSNALSTTGNVTSGYFVGNGSLLTNIAGGNVTGQVANALVAGTVYTNAQPNITSVGTLTSLTSSGNISTTGNIIGAFLWGDGGNITGTVQHAAAVRFPVKNTSGGPLTAGTPVYITGTVGATDTVEVSASRADTASTMGAAGLLVTDLANNATGYAISVGSLDNINTNAYTVGQTLYVAPTGGLTTTRPNDGNLVQTVGIVGRVNASNGIIETNIWNYNSLPNLGNGNVWVGNSSNYPTEQVAYGNSNVTTLLAAYGSNTISTTGNITSGNMILSGQFYDTTGIMQFNGSGNIALVPTVATIAYGDLSVTGNIVGNISQATGGYGDSNVVTLLSAFGSNSISTTGNVTSGNLNLSGQIYDSSGVLQLNGSGNIVLVPTGTTVAQGNLSATGNITGSYFIGNGSALTGITTSAGGSNTQIQFNDGGAFAGNAQMAFDKTTGNITLDGLVVQQVANTAVLNSVATVAPATYTATVPMNGRIIVGTGYNGCVTPTSASDQAFTMRGTRLLTSDSITFPANGNGYSQFSSLPYVTISGNTSNTGTQVQAGRFQMYIGGGTSANTILTTAATSGPTGVVTSITVGGNANISTGNTSVSHARGVGASINSLAGSFIGNAIAVQGSTNLAATTGANAANTVINFAASNSGAGVIATNLYGYYFASSGSTFGMNQSSQSRLTPNYFAFYNEDDLAKSKLGSLFQYHSFQYNTATTGSFAIDKLNGQVQSVALTGNVTITGFSNFVIGASNGSTAIPQVDTVTIIFRQDSTGRTVTLPTGSTYKYANGVSTMGSTANAVQTVEVTAFDAGGGTPNYLITVSPQFT